jgi:excisionase family DNA binding protein
VSGFLTDQRCARALGVSKRTVQRWCQAGELAGARKVGRSWRIPVEALREAELDAALLDDHDQRTIRAATFLCGTLRKEWIDMRAFREETGEWYPSERNWVLIASEVQQLRWALTGLPEGPGEIPDELA